VNDDTPRLSAETRLVLALNAATLGSPSSADLDRLREVLREVEDEPFIDRRLIAAVRGLLDGRLSREQASAIVATRGDGPRPRPTAPLPFRARPAKPGTTHAARSAVGDTSC